MTSTISIEKAPGACDSKGLEKLSNNFNCPMTLPPSKELEGLVAGFEWVGHKFHRADASVSKHCMTCYSQDFAQLPTFAPPLGVSHG